MQLFEHWTSPGFWEYWTFERVRNLTDNEFPEDEWWNFIPYRRPYKISIFGRCFRDYIIKGEINQKDGRKNYRLQFGGTRHQGSNRIGRQAGAWVLETFVGPKPEGMECCHGIGGCRDDRLINLRWDTRLANEADKIAQGTTARGEHHGMSKLTEEKVREIRRLYATGLYSQQDLAQIFEVDQALIWNIIHYKIWKHVA